jgi:glucose/arabinose dehydrogenase
VLTGHLADKIADTYEESTEARFALFPGGIVNVDQGPDGYLYVLTFAGKIYRVMPESG